MRCLESMIFSFFKTLFWGVEKKPKAIYTSLPGGEEQPQVMPALSSQLLFPWLSLPDWRFSSDQASPQGLLLCGLRCGHSESMNISSYCECLSRRPTPHGPISHLHSREIPFRNTSHSASRFLKILSLWAASLRLVFLPGFWLWHTHPCPHVCHASIRNEHTLRPLPSM